MTTLGTLILTLIQGIVAEYENPRKLSEREGPKFADTWPNPNTKFNPNWRLNIRGYVGQVPGPALID